MTLRQKTWTARFAISAWPRLASLKLISGHRNWEEKRKAAMGIPRLELSPHLIRLMNPEDQMYYRPDPNQSSAPDPKLRISPPPKRDVPERKEQADFANYLLLQNSQGRKIPFVWHATHTSSKATPGTPDFWVGINRRNMWIEFKRDYGCDLTPEQEEFRLCCEAQGIEMYVVYSAGEAIKLVEDADRLEF
jgi:hypothetical protein